MIEKVIVSRDEVLYYPWLDSTWIYLYYPKNPVTSNPLFTRLLEMILKRGISEVTGKNFGGLTVEDGYVFIKYDTNEIIEIVKGACAWIINRNLTPKDPTSPLGEFFIENKDVFTAFCEEAHKILGEKSYEYYYQCIDGMN